MLMGGLALHWDPLYNGHCPAALSLLTDMEELGCDEIFYVDGNRNSWGFFGGDIFRSLSLCHSPISHSFPSLIISSLLHLGIWKGQWFPNTSKQTFFEISEPEILIPFCELYRTEQLRPALLSGGSTGLTAAVLRGLSGSVEMSHFWHCAQGHLSQHCCLRSLLPTQAFSSHRCLN